MCLSDGVICPYDFETNKNPVRLKSKILRIISKLNKRYYNAGAILLFSKAS
jgi:hypothetical protein